MRLELRLLTIHKVKIVAMTTFQRLLTYEAVLDFFSCLPLRLCVSLAGKPALCICIFYRELVMHQFIGRALITIQWPSCSGCERLKLNSRLARSICEISIQSAYKCVFACVRTLMRFVSFYFIICCLSLCLFCPKCSGLYLSVLDSFLVSDVATFIDCQTPKLLLVIRSPPGSFISYVSPVSVPPRSIILGAFNSSFVNLKTQADPDIFCCTNSICRTFYSVDHCGQI